MKQLRKATKKIIMLIVVICFLCTILFTLWLYISGRGKDSITIDFKDIPGINSFLLTGTHKIRNSSEISVYCSPPDSGDISVMINYIGTQTDRETFFEAFVNEFYTTRTLCFIQGYMCAKGQISYVFSNYTTVMYIETEQDKYIYWCNDGYLPDNPYEFGASNWYGITDNDLNEYLSGSQITGSLYTFNQEEIMSIESVIIESIPNYIK